MNHKPKPSHTVPNYRCTIHDENLNDENMKVTIYPKFNFKLKKVWRWKIVSENHKIVAASSESFADRRNCVDNIHLTFKALREFVDPTSKVVK